MQSKSSMDGRPQSDDDSDLKQMFRRSAPSFARVDLDAVLADARRSSSAGAAGAGVMGRLNQPEPARPIGARSAVRSLPRRRIVLARLCALGVCAAGICVALTFSLGGGTPLLAQVQSALKKVRTATYTVTHTMEDQPALTWRVKLLGENLCRVEQPNGIYLVFDIRAKKMMEVNPGESKVRIIENLPVPQGFNVLATLTNLKAAAAKDQPAAPDREIDGKSAAGFAIEDNGVVYNVWVDRATNLPLEMERVGDREGQPPTTENWSDFRFDEPMDEAMFSFEVPDGYAVDTRQAPRDAADAQKKAAEQYGKRE